MVVFLAVAHLVIPPFFLVCVSMFNCVFFFPFHLLYPPSFSEHARVRGHNNWATPSFFDVVRHTDACTHMHSCTHTCRHTKVKSRQTALTLRALCLSLLSQSADSQKRKNKAKALMCSHVCHMHISRFWQHPLRPGKGAHLCASELQCMSMKNWCTLCPQRQKNYSLYWDEKCSDGCGCRHVVKTQSLNIIPVRSSATLSRPFRFWLEAWKQVAGTGKMFWT